MKILFSNKKINLNYLILERYECGIVLEGSEVKSLINANGSIDEAFAIISNQQLYIINMYIAPYLYNTTAKIDSYRRRKLLMHKNEIQKISYQIKKQHLTLVPAKIYIQNNVIKIEIALAKHKNSKDKRETIKDRDAKRETKKY
ncbi:MAG: SsrA-binding protein [Mycoplasmataceae bacterium]|jgi:SsrA-binding protein|nr:SsrA-binding protein [Mycoplasmataceae bacterium]